MLHLGSILIYYAPLAILSLSFGRSRYITPIIIVTSGIILTTLSLRYDVGFDYLNYERHYEQEIRQPEPISRLIFTTTRTLNSSNYLFAAYALITILPILAVSLKNKSVTILSSYICLPWFYTDSFTIIRQAAAISICFLLYDSFRRKNKAFWLLILIPAGLHFSSIPMLLVLITARLIPHANKALVCIALCIPLFLPIALDQLSTFYPRINLYDGRHDYGLSQLILGIVLLLMIFNKYSTNRHSTIIGIGALAQYFLLTVDPVLARCAYYFYIPLCFIPWQTCFYKIKTQRILIFTLYVAIFSYSLYIKSNQEEGPMIPYRTIFSKE